MIKAIKRVNQSRAIRTSFIKPLPTVQVKVAHASVASSKTKIVSDSYEDACVDSYDQKDGHKSAKQLMLQWATMDYIMIRNISQW